MSTSHDRTLPVAVFATLGLLAGFAPLGIDMYLPALTRIADDLAAPPSYVQLTLTTFLLGIACGQLVIGPISDRFGRRSPLLLGLIVCVASTVLCALAPNVTILVIGRFVQGFSGSAGIVISRAVISDRTSGKQAARYFSVLAAISGVAPVIAPLLGGLVVIHLGWRGVFGVLATIVAISLIVTAIVIDESLPATDRTPAGGSHTRSNIVRMCRDRRYLSYTVMFAACFAGLMAYISASPFVFDESLGLTTTQFTVVFATNALGLMSASLINARLLTFFDVHTLLRAGQLSLMVCALLLTTIAATGLDHVTIVVPVIFGLVTSAGFVLGNAGSLALAQTPYAFGTGAAVLGAMQASAGAMTSPLVGLGGQDAILPLGLIATACSATGLLLNVGRTHHDD